jgi:hypothetical protein
VEAANDYGQRSYMLQLQNLSTYFGYQIWMATGLQYDKIKYNQTIRSFENYKTSTLFVKVFLGFSPPKQMYKTLCPCQRLLIE